MDSATAVVVRQGQHKHVAMRCMESCGSNVPVELRGTLHDHPLSYAMSEPVGQPVNPYRYYEPEGTKLLRKAKRSEAVVRYKFVVQAGDIHKQLFL